MEIGWGTWGSNPGPRDYQPNALLMELWTRFDYIITNKYHKTKQALVADFRVNFKWTNHRLTPHLLLPCCALPAIKTNWIAGVLNPPKICPFQGKKTILLCSWGFKERAWIKSINSNIKNWYIEVKLFHFFLHIRVLVFKHSHCNFWWIHTNWLILQLTIWFNWVFTRCMKNHHWSTLGFQTWKIGGLLLWKNWTIRMMPLNSWGSTGSNTHLAPNLWSKRAYSLFSVRWY